MQAHFVKARIHFAVYPRTCPYRRCKITSNPPNRPIWFVDAPLWFVNAAFCISKHPTSVKNHLHFRTFSSKSLHIQINALSLQQQIPPRFPFEQRTRAELRFYRDMDYTKNALDYTQILTQLKKHRGRNSTKGADVYWFWLTVLFVNTIVVYTLIL